MLARSQRLAHRFLKLGSTIVKSKKAPSSRFMSLQRPVLSAPTSKNVPLESIRNELKENDIKADNLSETKLKQNQILVGLLDHLSPVQKEYLFMYPTDVYYTKPDFLKQQIKQTHSKLGIFRTNQDTAAVSLQRQEGDEKVSSFLVHHEALDATHSINLEDSEGKSFTRRN